MATEPVAASGAWTKRRIARPLADARAQNARPMKPLAPVTATAMSAPAVSCRGKLIDPPFALARSGLVRPRGGPSGSQPPPAVLRVEAKAAADELRDVAPAFARRSATMMDDADARHERVARHFFHPHAPVEILEIEEKSWIEPAGAVNGFAPSEHERARHHRHAERFLRRIGVDDIAHLVAIEPPGEQALDEARCKPAKQQVEHRRIALAQVLPLTRSVADGGRERARLGMRIEPAHRVDERIGG